MKCEPAVPWAEAVLKPRLCISQPGTGNRIFPVPLSSCHNNAVFIWPIFFIQRQRKILKKHVDLQWYVGTRDCFPLLFFMQSFSLENIHFSPSYFHRALHSLCPSPGKEGTRKCFWVGSSTQASWWSSSLTSCLRGQRRSQEYTLPDAITSYWWKTACLGGKPFSQAVICLELQWHCSLCQEYQSVQKSLSHER